jgi:acetolactate synthase-1/3 small subunit
MNTVALGERRHLLSILVENTPGELARIVGLFSGRGFNIDSLAVNTTLEPDKSRVVLTTRGDDQVIEQITKQLNKLVRVHKVLHLQGAMHLERELCLVTVRASGPKGREELERLLRLCGGRIVAFASTSFTVELTGTEAEIDHFLEMARPLGIRNMVRSAPIAITKPAELEAAAADTAA